MADALTTYHQEKLDRARDRADRATDELRKTRAALAQARADETQDIANAATLDATMSATRSAMAGPGQTAADIEALAETLRTDMIARRKIDAARAERGARVASLTALDHGLSGLVAQTSAAVTTAEIEHAAAEAAEARQAPFATSETTDTLAEVTAAAQMLLNEIGDTPDAASDPDSDDAAWRALIIEAKDQVEAIFPEVLRDHARARAAQGRDLIVAQITGQVTSVEDAAAAWLVATGGLDGAAEAVLAHARAEAALGATASGAPRAWARALGLLESAAAAAPLSSAQAAEMTERALPADDPALASELALIDAKTAVTVAEIELQSAIHDALLVDPNADPNAHADVVAAQAALDAAAGTPLSDATAAHTADHAAALDAWEVAVPAISWTALANYDTALVLLADVAASDLATRRTEFDAAEAALVTALQQIETTGLAQHVARVGPAIARARADAVGDLGAAQRLSALRGDA